MAELGLVFAFAPNNGYFIEYRGRRRWRNIPDSLVRLLTANTSDGVGRTLCLCFGENDSYVIVYEDKSKTPRVVHKNLPTPLADWIEDKPEFMKDRIKPEPGWKVGLDSLRISLGSEGRFLATKEYVTARSNRVRICRWDAGGDPGLEEKLQFYCTSSTAGIDSWETITRVIFGPGRGYYLLRKDPLIPLRARGRLSHRTRGALMDMESRLSSQWRIADNYIVLDLFCEDRYFILGPDGIADWRVHGSYEGVVKKFAATILEDQSVSGSTSRPESGPTLLRTDYNNSSATLTGTRGGDECLTGTAIQAGGGATASPRPEHRVPHQQARIYETEDQNQYVNTGKATSNRFAVKQETASTRRPRASHHETQLRGSNFENQARE